jgi:hypothetical protein
MQAHDMYALESHALESHAHKRYPYGIHAYEMQAYDTYLRGRYSYKRYVLSLSLSGGRVARNRIIEKKKPPLPFLLFYPTASMEGSYRTEASASFKLSEIYIGPLIRLWWMMLARGTILDFQNLDFGPFCHSTPPYDGTFIESAKDERFVTWHITSASHCAPSKRLGRRVVRFDISTIIGPGKRLL